MQDPTLILYPVSLAARTRPGFRSLTARKLIGALVRDGFVLDRTAGAHQIYYHPDDRRRVTVSLHGSGQTFPPKTLKKMIEIEARWTESDLQRLVVRGAAGDA